MAAVFSMQGLGQLGGALVMLCLTSGFKDSLSTAVATTSPKTTAYQNCVGECAVSVDKMWRALIGTSGSRAQLVSALPILGRTGYAAKRKTRSQ